MTTGDPMSSFCGGAATAGDIEEATNATVHPNSMPSLEGRCRCFIGVLISHRSVTGCEVPGNRTFDLGSGRPRVGPHGEPGSNRSCQASIQICSYTPD